MKTLFNYTGYVINIVDGDTVDVSIDLGYHVKIDVRLRLAGINTAELTSKDQDTKDLAIIAKEVLTKKVFNRTITIDSKGKDKYGRWIADIKLDGRNINSEMVTEGYAVEYMK